MSAASFYLGTENILLQSALNIHGDAWKDRHRSPGGLLCPPFANHHHLRSNLLAYGFQLLVNYGDLDVT